MHYTTNLKPSVIPGRGPLVRLPQVVRLEVPALDERDQLQVEFSSLLAITDLQVLPLPALQKRLLLMFVLGLEFVQPLCSNVWGRNPIIRRCYNLRVRHHHLVIVKRRQ